MRVINRIWGLLLPLLCTASLYADLSYFQGWAERGGARVVTAGALSTTRVQQSAPGATYTVKLFGTATDASLYSDAAGTTPKACPCAVDASGSYGFYTSPGQYSVSFAASGVPSWTIAITVGGTTAGLGPVTFNVVSEGAAGGTDSTAAFLSAWNKAIAASTVFASAAIYIPASGSQYTVTQCMPAFVGKAVRVYGDGNGASVINFAPAAPCGAFATWQPTASQSTMNFIQADGFGIVGVNAVTKTGLKLIAASYGSHLRDIRIQLLHTGDTALELQGWDQTSIADSFLEGTYPVSVKKVTAGTFAASGQFDHFNFHNTILFSYDDTQPLVSFENGVSCSNLSMTGRQTWVGGSDGLKFVSASTFNFNSIQNVRWENGASQIATPALHGYMFDIEPGATSVMLTFINCSGGSTGQQGFKIRNVKTITFNNTRFTGSWTSSFAQLDLDNTTDRISLLGAEFPDVTNATRALGAAFVEMSGAPAFSLAGTLMPVYAFYAQRSGAGVDYDVSYLQGQAFWKTYVVSLSVGASTTLPSPGNFTTPGLSRVTIAANHATLADATEEYGNFITGWFGPHLLSGSTSVAAGDTAGKLSLIYAGGGNPMTLKNNLTVPVRVKIIID